jgi:hypothetical protein
VRAGAGQNWSGSSGQLELGPERIELHDLQSASSAGTLAIAGSFDRAGRNAGDLLAKIDARGVPLDNLSLAYRGTVDAHVDVMRTSNHWGGQVNVKATGVATSPAMAPLDLDAKITPHSGTRLVDGGIQGSEKTTGGTLQLRDLKAPALRGTVLANPKAVRDLPLEITAAVPPTQAATFLAVFGRSEVTGGTIQGDIKIAGTVGAPTARANFIGLALKFRPASGTDRSRPSKRSPSPAPGTARPEARDRGYRARWFAPSRKALPESTLVLQAKNFELVPLLAFEPGPAGGGAGRLDANIKVLGLDPKTTRLAGELHLTDARLPIAPMFGTLRKAKFDLVASDHEMKVDVAGTLGDGTVKINAAFALDGALPTGGDATVTLRKVSPISNVEPVIDADITAKFHRESDRWVVVPEVSASRSTLTVTRSRGMSPMISTTTGRFNHHALPTTERDR